MKKGLDRILNILTGTSFLVMVVIVAWQVAARYVFKNPSTWSEEMVSYMFAWTSLFGACLVTGERGHMNIPIIVERFPESTRRFFMLLEEVIALLFSAVVLLYGGTRITKLAMGQSTSSLGVAVGVFYTVLPAAGILNGIYTILNIYEILRGHDGDSGQKMEG